MVESTPPPPPPPCKIGLRPRVPLTRIAGPQDRATRPVWQRSEHSWRCVVDFILLSSLFLKTFVYVLSKRYESYKFIDSFESVSGICVMASARSEERRFKASIAITKAEDDSPVFFKVDGERFEDSRTLKLTINTNYKLAFEFQPPLELWCVKRHYILSIYYCTAALV